MLYQVSVLLPPVDGLSYLYQASPALLGEYGGTASGQEIQSLHTRTRSPTRFTALIVMLLTCIDNPNKP